MHIKPCFRYLYLHRLLYDILEYLINLLLQIGSLKVKTQNINPMKILFFLIWF